MIVGLGNVGQEYNGTRHNIGFEVLDKLASTLSVSFSTGCGPYAVAEGRHKRRKVTLVKPTDYVNRSGTAVKKALAKYKIDKKDCLVVYDDLNLPVGAIRMKRQGSDGGHNGIADINEKLRTKEYPRLRIGIGNDFKRGRQVEFVLSPFEIQRWKKFKFPLKKRTMLLLHL